MIQISDYNLYIGMAINGIFTGLGATIGAYIANNHLIDTMKKIKKRLGMR